MEGAKEYFLEITQELINDEFLSYQIEMFTDVKVSLKMSQHNFENNLSPSQRQMFSKCEVQEVNEYENNKDDPNYIKLVRERKQHKKLVKEYLFKKRNG